VSTDAMPVNAAWTLQGFDVSSERGDKARGLETKYNVHIADPRAASAS